MGCGRRAPKAELVRFVARDGTLALDAEGRQPGRGAYLCRREECARRAIARRSFSRVLRQPVALPEKTLDFISHGQ